MTVSLRRPVKSGSKITRDGDLSSLEGWTMHKAEGAFHDYHILCRGQESLQNQVT